MGEPSQPCLAELVAASNKFIIGLRMREGPSEGGFQRLSLALRSCATAWEGLDEIPRLGANVLVDIFPATEASADLYGGQDKARIQEMAFKLHELVQACVEVNEPA